MLKERFCQGHDGASAQTAKALMNERAEPAALSQTGFMEGHQANGAFVACGPPGFTALALINLGSQARKMSEVMFLFPCPTALSAPEVLT